MANSVLKLACQNQLVASFMNKFVRKWYKIVYFDHLDLENNLLQKEKPLVLPRLTIQYSVRQIDALFRQTN